MASMAAPATFRYPKKFHERKIRPYSKVSRIILSQSLQHDDGSAKPIARREVVLKSSGLAVIGAVFQFSGKKPDYLGVQKSPAGLALCPATNNCISTSESASDLVHYAPPWNYNGTRKKPVGKDVAMEELLQVIKTTNPNKYVPHILEETEDYVYVEYESPFLGFVDDVEFWFPPGKTSRVEYRSASRKGNFDFDVNRKRIKFLRQELEKKGWASENGV